MKEYHKIDSIFKRDPKGKFLIGEWSRPEFEYLADNPWLWTEKIDGTNIRVMYQDEGNDMLGPFWNVTFGGKTDNAQIPAKLVKHLEDTFTISAMENVFGMTGSRICLYGEGYGAGIQKGGGNYSPDQKFILFDVKIGDWWLQREDVQDIASKLNIEVVPIHGYFTLREMIDAFFSERHIPPKSKISETALTEGYVGTPVVPLFARNGDRIITKIKYKDVR